MSLIIPLGAVPNQSLSIRLEGSRYVLRLKEAGGMMAIDIDRDGDRVVSGMRCAAGTPLLPYEYLERQAGNFMFVSSEPGAIPYWRDFGTRTRLFYLTAAEVRNDAA